MMQVVQDTDELQESIQQSHKFRYFPFALASPDEALVMVDTRGTRLWLLTEGKSPQEIAHRHSHGPSYRLYRSARRGMRWWRLALKVMKIEHFPRTLKVIVYRENRLYILGHIEFKLAGSEYKRRKAVFLPTVPE